MYNQVACRKKGCSETNPKELQEHHFIPKCFEGKEIAEKRMRRYLCKKHHDIFHYTLSCWLWKDYILKEDKEKILDSLEKRGEAWLETPD